ncbi:MAG: type II toxin-antitoxin system RelE/ParE family toxin [Bacteroidota bacterium]|nr:type II toxin-antitoxin system RelE/ParE family toxin [Bacteroidota bacterium]
MARYRFTSKAVNDLTEIWNHTYFKWSENQADKYYQMLLDTCAQVADNPDLGKDYSIVIDKLLGFRAGRHIIFYRCIEADEIEVIRILHEQMDLGNRILGSAY